jgi:hypothetical protein
MRAAFVLIAALAAGCGGNVKIPAVPQPVDTSSHPLIDDAEFANWKRFPVGTQVKRKSVASSDRSTNTTTSVETFTLKELTDNELVVERQNTTERNDGSYKAAHPSQLRRIARQFSLPPGMSADDFAKPSRIAKLVGEEDVVVLDKTYKAKVYTWEESSEAGKMQVKVWMTDDLPSRIARQVIRIEALGNQTVEEVIAVSP